MGGAQNHANKITPAFFLDPPVVELNLGHSVDIDNIREGDDIVFDCDVEANPHPINIYWVFKVNKTILIYMYINIYVLREHLL